MIPVRDDAHKALSSGMKQHAFIDFLATGVQGLSKSVNETIDFLIGSHGPKASMITKSMADYEKSKITISQDTVV